MDTTSPNPHPEARSLAGLFADLWRNTSLLFREEAELAKAEISEKVSQVGTGIAALAVGGAIVFSGFLVLLAAAVNGLALVLQTEHAVWLAPLIVGVVVLIAGLAILAKGRSDLKTSNLKPSRTAQSLRRDSELAKEHLR
jgi:hypothetical protein